MSEGVPWERWILCNCSEMRVHARLSFIVTSNSPSSVTLIRCFIGRSKPLGRLEEFGRAVFHKEVKIQRSPGTPSKRRLPNQRKTQRTKLALLVATMLDVRSANLMEL